MKRELTIEQERGETYCNSTYAVYEHRVHERGSVLAGLPQRIYIEGSFLTPEAAKAKFPDATIIAGSTHIPIDQQVAHLPDDEEY